MFQAEHDVHRLLSVERSERLRADAVDRPRRRGAFRRTSREAIRVRPHSIRWEEMS
jgi:hypothetical protein